MSKDGKELEKKRGRAHVVLEEEDSEENVLLLCLANCMKMCGPPKIPRIRAVSRAVSNTIIVVVVSGAKWRLYSLALVCLCMRKS